MAKYCITAAKPKTEAHDLKSQFKLWKLEVSGGKESWFPQGWKRTTEIAALLGAGHQVLSAKKTDAGISIGKAVELELRISKMIRSTKLVKCQRINLAKCLLS